MPTRSLVIALDGVDHGLCRRAQESGAAPYLKTLSERLTTRTVPYRSSTSDDAMWANFQYGATLGEHGRYFWKRDNPTKKGDFQYCTAGEESLQPVWLEEPFREKNIAVFDLPKMRVVRPVKGIHLANWLVHGRYGLEGATSEPPEIAVHVRNRFGEPPPSICGDPAKELSPEQIERFVGYLLQSMDMKLSAAVTYLQRESWDCFMTSFKELHCASHALWDIQDQDFAQSPFFRLFQALDKSVKKLVETAGEDAELCIFSPSGMDSNSTVTHLLDKLLQKLGEETTTGLQRLMRGRPYTLMPYNENSVAIRLAPRWREKADSLWPEVAKIMSGLTTGEDGESIFEEPLIPGRDWKGEAAAHLPDMIFPLKPGLGRPETLHLRGIGKIAGERRAYRQGNHFGDGFCYLGEKIAAHFPGGNVKLEELSRAALSV